MEGREASKFIFPDVSHSYTHLKSFIKVNYDYYSTCKNLILLSPLVTCPFCIYSRNV